MCIGGADMLNSYICEESNYVWSKQMFLVELPEKPIPLKGGVGLCQKQWQLLTLLWVPRPKN